MDDEETVALAAAIRTPFTPSAARPYEPPPPRPAYPPPPLPRPYPPVSYGPVPYVYYPVPILTVRRKEVGVAYLLWFFFGALGVHHFYLGHLLRGVLYLLTGGFLGVGLLVDLFLIPSLTRRRNAEELGRLYPYPVIAR